MLKAGEEIQTDKIWVDPANGDRYIVFRKMIDTGALPNLTTKNVAHGITGISHLKYCTARLWATNGTLSRCIAGDPVVNVDATNVQLVAATNLSTYTASVVVLEYVKTAVKV